MSATTESEATLLQRTRNAAHPRCIVCSLGSSCGLGLRFTPRSDGSVRAIFECSRRWQGYDGVLHGGVTSSLLDGAMTNCLFARGIVAVTAEMRVRFRHPVELDTAAEVRAHVSRSQSPLHVVEAEVVQGGKVKATATGKFMEKDSP